NGANAIIFSVSSNLQFAFTTLQFAMSLAPRSASHPTTRDEPRRERRRPWFAACLPREIANCKLVNAKCKLTEEHIAGEQVLAGETTRRDSARASPSVVWRLPAEGDCKLQISKCK